MSKQTKQHLLLADILAIMLVVNLFTELTGGAMIVEEILEQLEESEHPVAKTFHLGDHFKVLIFGFKKGMKLKDHKSKHPTKLLVMEGDVIYTQEKRDHRLKKHDEVHIPAHVSHTVSALDDSLVLLTQG